MQGVDPELVLAPRETEVSVLFCDLRGFSRHSERSAEDLLGLLSNKKMVLIDTSGVAPRDPRKRDMLDVLDLPGVNRLLVINAGGHGDIGHRRPAVRDAVRKPAQPHTPARARA